MRSVTVVYHCEDGNWWADSPEPGLETFVAGGRGLEETRELAAEGLEFHLGEQTALTEVFEDGELMDERGTRPSVVIDSPSFATPRPATATRPAAVSVAIPLPIALLIDEPVRGAA